MWPPRASAGRDLAAPRLRVETRRRAARRRRLRPRPTGRCSAAASGRHPARGRLRLLEPCPPRAAGDVIVIEDLGSTNGTYLNGEPLQRTAAAARRRPHPHRRLRVLLRALMLRIAEHWHGSDPGRQRQGNEDNFFVRAPLFVVADGMGGAQAGEVASRSPCESFEPGLGDGAPAEALVRRDRGGQPAHPRPLALRRAARRHGHDAHGRLRRRGRRGRRPRRRLARLPADATAT